jgi:hypothetical protein
MSVGSRSLLEPDERAPERLLPPPTLMLNFFCAFQMSLARLTGRWTSAEPGWIMLGESRISLRSSWMRANSSLSSVAASPSMSSLRFASGVSSASSAAPSATSRW